VLAVLRPGDGARRVIIAVIVSGLTIGWGLGYLAFTAIIDWRRSRQCRLPEARTVKR